ncbi:MAG: sulfotransferase family protein [Stellaceae bacterium]
MSLKVIGAGFGRTGTRSLKEALEMLGFGPCHHMVEVFMHPEQVPLWDRAALGQMQNWEEIFATYNSACDWPSCSFYKELADFYPDAKVILTLRDPKAWYKSVSSTIMPAMKKPEEGQERRLPGIFGPKIIGENTFGFDFGEENMIATYLRHNEEVKRTVPRDSLLVFEAMDGWEPLCTFIGVEVPAQPYPKMNTTEEFQARVAGTVGGPH